MATTLQDKFIGSGYIFPIELENGKPKLRRGDFELIRSSLRILLSWPQNDRLLLAEFGSRLEELIGQQNDDILNALVIQFITEAINRFERRIELLRVDVIKEKNTSINLQLTYKIRTTNLEDSFLFPFYRKVIY